MKFPPFLALVLWLVTFVACAIILVVEVIQMVRGGVTLPSGLVVAAMAFGSATAADRLK